MKQRSRTRNWWWRTCWSLRLFAPGESLSYLCTRAWIFFFKYMTTGCWDAALKVCLILGEKWQSRRKMLAPSFCNMKLQNFISIFYLNASILAEKLAALADAGDQQTEQINICPLVTLCSLDIICGKQQIIYICFMETILNIELKWVLCELLAERPAAVHLIIF